MANNVTIPARGDGTNKPVIATDEVAGAHYQRFKPDLGADGLSVRPSTNAGAADGGTQRVVLATDQAVLPTQRQASATADVKARVAASASSQQLLAANANRTGFIIANDGDQILYLKFGVGATLTDFTVLLLPQGHYTDLATVRYTGRVDGIWAGAPTGGAQVTEFSV